MSFRGAKQIVYRYNDDENSEEFEVDLDGEVLLPQTGEFMIRKVKQWKAVHRIVESSAGVIPIIRIFLSDQFGSTRTSPSRNSISCTSPRTSGSDSEADE